MMNPIWSINEANINAYCFSPHTANSDIMPPPQDVPGIQNDSGDNVQNNDQNEVALSQLSIEEYLPTNIPAHIPEEQRQFCVECKKIPIWTESISLLIMKLLVLRSFMRVAKHVYPLKLFRAGSTYLRISQHTWS